VDPDQHIEGAPDLAVEVVSPSDSAEDLRTKVRQYLAAGGHTVWIVYARSRIVEVFQAGGVIQELSGDQVLQAPELLPGFSMCAEHVRQLEGESPFDNLMEVKS
jgi:Uma2 family endonuclease